MTDLANKLRGGYYTPAAVAKFICDWAIASPGLSVLEPSCGDGVFIQAANARLKELGSADPAEQILGVELYEAEAEKASKKGGRIICGDFFAQCQEGLGESRFDVVVGNPPFIRYQDFDETYRTSAFELMRRYGFSPNRLTNIWLPFLVVCSHLLAEDGSLGMVIPAELFQVKYSAETRRFLMDFFESVTIVTFSELLFDGAQQEVVLLLARRCALGGEQGVRIIEKKDASDLADLTPEAISAMPLKRKLPDSMKWQAYYLDDNTLDLITELEARRDVLTSSELFDVNVGVVSGQNSFFVVDEKTARANNIMESCVPIVSRSLQLDGLSFTEEDFQRQLDLQRKVLLFLPTGELGDDEESYVRLGEEKGYDRNFKCRIRKPWYAVPTSWAPDAFFYRQVGAYPRIVINDKKAQTTDTLHKVRFAEGVDGKSVAVAFNNSLTFVVSELMGRSYGGGVLTFEPSEARSLPIPFEPSARFDFEKADSLARNGEVEQLLDYVDGILLLNSLGLDKSDVMLLRESWRILRDRRLNRKKR